MNTDEEGADLTDDACVEEHGENILATHRAALAN